jgi:hypothetical protein
MDDMDGGNVALGESMQIRECSLRAWREVSGEENVLQGWNN